MRTLRRKNNNVLSRTVNINMFEKNREVDVKHYKFLHYSNKEIKRRKERIQECIEHPITYRHLH